MSENIGNIKIPLHEVWELLNKPHRFYNYLYGEVNKLKIGDYLYLKLDKATKKELLQRIRELQGGACE